MLIARRSRSIVAGLGLRRSLSTTATPANLVRFVSDEPSPPKRKKRPHGSIPKGQPEPPRQQAADPSRDIIVPLNGVETKLSYAFLRDSCLCPKCKDPSTQQKLFQTSDIPADITGTLVEDTSDSKEAVSIKWTNDVPGYDADHITRLPIATLKKRFSGMYVDPMSRRKAWDKATIEKTESKWVQYRDYMDSDEALYKALKHLNQFGLLFLKGVPDDEKAIEGVVGRIGIIKNTFYGKTWDVKSVPNAKNIAYTHQFLGLHMDLLYTKNPPHLQLLHSLRARAPGGESLFSDALYAAERLWQDPSLRSDFKQLASFPVPYQYHNDSQHYQHKRVTLETSRINFRSPSWDKEDKTPQVFNVNWSPPFQGPFEGRDSSNLSSYVVAAKKFSELLESEGALFEYRMEEGDLVIFDNRRVLHARRAFDAEKGERWLKGAYIDNDVYFSRLRVLEEQFQSQPE